MTMPKAIDVTGEVIGPDHEDITPLFARHMAAYSFFAGYAADKNVLEVGFGEGYGTHYLAGYARRITGVDVSPELVAHARGKYAADNLEFTQGDAASLPFEGGSFDVVVSSQVIEHVKDYNRCLAGMERVLAPGGTALVATPNRKMMIDGVNPYHFKEFSATELEAALKGVFAAVEVMGLFGSPRYMELKAAEQGFAGRILALDFLRLRRFVPRAVIKPLYRRAFTAVNRRTEAASAVGGDITAADFRVSEGDADRALDLVGVCTKGGR